MAAAEVRFYHLVGTRMEVALGQLLGKCYGRGWRAVVRTTDDDRAEQLCRSLWVQQDRGFLPHGTRRDGEAREQPIWLTAVDENPNRATVLFVTDGATASVPDGISLICEFVDGSDEARVAQARTRWAAYRSAGHEVTYWRQDPRGRWEQAGGGEQT